MASGSPNLGAVSNVSMRPIVMALALLALLVVVQGVSAADAREKIAKVDARAVIPTIYYGDEIHMFWDGKISIHAVQHDAETGAASGLISLVISEPGKHTRTDYAMARVTTLFVRDGKFGAVGIVTDSGRYYWEVGTVVVVTGADDDAGYDEIDFSDTYTSDPGPAISRIREMLEPGAPSGFGEPVYEGYTEVR